MYWDLQQNNWSHKTLGLLKKQINENILKMVKGTDFNTTGQKVEHNSVFHLEHGTDYVTFTSIL